MPRQTRRYIQDYPALDLTGLIKKGFLKNGGRGESSCKARERVLWSFGWHCMDSIIKVRYTQSSGDFKRNFEHDISLVRQSAHYGGERLYLACPKCQSKRKQIYFVDGVAACRSCHVLHYKSQSESSKERKYRKLDRLLGKVDSFGSRFDGHWKAKGQHWKTFYKLHNQIHTTQKSILKDMDTWIVRFQRKL